MGLAKRIIPTILKRGAAQVKGKQFNSWRSVGVAMQACKIMAARGADEIVLLDIDATPSGKGPDFAAIRELAADFLTPLAVGGGIKTVADVKALLDSGADKVVIGNAALRGTLIHDCAKRYGSQAIIVIIDVDEGRVRRVNGNNKPVQAAYDLAACGAGEILLTSVDREGMMEGYDLELIEQVSKTVDIPVIAHGGCGTPEHMLQAIHAGASAVAAGSMFLFTEETPKSCALYLQERGIEVRIP